MTQIESERVPHQSPFMPSPPQLATVPNTAMTPRDAARRLIIALIGITSVIASPAPVAAQPARTVETTPGSALDSRQEDDRSDSVSSPPARGATRLRDTAAPEASPAGQRPFPTSTGRDALPALSQAAFAAGRPLVVMFSLRGCPWCDALRREHFASLIATQERLGVLAIEIDLTDSRPFDAARASDSGTPPAPALRADNPRELGRLHRVRLAPTVLFLGPNGEVAERLVGYGSPDFFGGYLDQRIAHARAALGPAPR